eukprot:TRINITY_DN23353_c0_g1_i1.p1 TRINITY_DN23353_c0_g1~~TRINITY_DN23353_c0_g1_i1.p1  ORF type:complete len:785 (-),score=138.91 TRINITY_DN23353_c0_g1_i1:232-2334(-)
MSAANHPKGRTPWSFFHVCDDADSLGLLALSRKIPDEWIDWNHGGRRSRARMHSTVILKMTEPAHLQRLQRLAAKSGPLRIEVQELFCERVERIWDAEVYCIGVALSSPGLRQLKDAWTSEEPAERRRSHVPYDGEGHITLAYIRSDCLLQAQGFVAQHRSELRQAHGLVINALTYEDANGAESSIAFRDAVRGRSRSRSREASRKTTLHQQERKLQEIDGSVLEGGGQILRMAGAYSALFQVPVRISKIRAGRSRPGLAAQHLESLRLVRDLSSATLTNDRVGSSEVYLAPRALTPGNFRADPGTAGAITLMIQASLFPLLYAGGPSTCDLGGGTDVSYSPPLGFLEHVLVPTLHRMGANFSIDCRLRGFFPRGGGNVKLDVKKLETSLRAIDLSERGEVAKVSAVLYATHPLADEVAAKGAVRKTLEGLASQVSVQFCKAPASGGAAKYWLDAVVETSTGSLFHGSTEPADLGALAVFGGGKGFRGGGGAPLSGNNAAAALERMGAAAREVAASLAKQLSSGAAVDCHLCDQLVLPASLAAGRSRLLVAEPSLHARTALHIAELLVPGVKIRESRRGALSLIEIDGIGFTPLADGATRSTVSPAGAVSGTENAKQDDRVFVPVPAGSLSRAAPELLQDFRNDMEQLASDEGATISIDERADRLLIGGGAPERNTVLAALEDVFAFYFNYKFDSKNMVK